MPKGPKGEKRPAEPEEKDGQGAFPVGTGQGVGMLEA